MKKMLVAWMAFLSGLLLFCSPGFAGESVLRIGLAKEPAKLNPVLIPGLYGEAVAGNIFDTLVSFKENDSVPAPDLAERWEISEDGKTYTFYLRQDVSFHNGAPLTAADVKFTLSAIMDPKNASPSKTHYDSVDRVETEGDHVVRIYMKAPYAPLLLALGSDTCGILPKALAEKQGMEEFDRHPVGTGAFKFVEWVPDERIVLVKNPSYFMGEPKVDKVVFRPITKPEVMAAEIESGNLDIAQQLNPQDVNRLATDKRFQVLTIPGRTNSYLGFSYVKAPFSDVRFRKAVYYAVPFDAAIKGIWQNQAERAYSWIPPGVFPDDMAFMKAAALPYDKAKATALFDELKKDGVLKEGFEFPIYTSQNPFRVKIATAIATELRKYGLKAKVEALEWGTLFPILKNDPGFYILGWGSVPDPDRWTYKIFHSTSTMNFSKYNDPAVDEALALGRSLVDTGKRSEQYRMVMRKALATEYIHIPLVFKNISNVCASRVKDFRPDSAGLMVLVTQKRNVSLKSADGQ